MYKGNTYKVTYIYDEKLLKSEISAEWLYWEQLLQNIFL